MRPCPIPPARLLEFLVVTGWLMLAVPGMVGMAGAQSPVSQPFDYSRSTAVVFNSNDKESVALAQFYAAARQIPAANLVGLDAPGAETVSRNEYEAFIAKPLRREFDRRKWWKLRKLGGEEGTQAVENKIHVVALMRGIPLRISEYSPPFPRDTVTGKARTPEPPATGQQNQASVDSEIALLGALDIKQGGAQKNRYYGADAVFAKANQPQMLLVGRIDGPDDATARRLITDALAAEQSGLWGKCYFDLAQKTGSGYGEGEKWISNAARLFGANGYPVIVDPHPSLFPAGYPMRDAIAYFGWYAGAAEGPFRDPGFRFKQGAIACHLHSYSAASIRNPDAYWVAPLLSRGACAVLGNVWEPYLSLTQHFDLFVARLLQGYTFAEATYMATPALSWMNVAVGDPLYRPFSPTAGLGSKEEDADYKALRVALGRWGSNEADRDTLLQNIEKAAGSLNSGTLWEALGFLLLKPGDFDDSISHFKTAETVFSDPADKLRARLHHVEILRSAKDSAGATALLNELRQEYASTPGVAAIDAYLAQINPPPSPQPAAE